MQLARLAQPAFQVQAEHFLQKFAPLLESNPRAMKRLLNAYITNWALAVLSYLDIDREQLTLWIILALR